VCFELYSIGSAMQVDSLFETAQRLGNFDILRDALEDIVETMLQEAGITAVNFDGDLRALRYRLYETLRRRLRRKLNAIGQHVRLRRSHKK
jgi:hypothetical protein